MIFGIGLSKTGTTSLYAALCQLGYRTITYRHMRDHGLSDWLNGNFESDYFADIDAATDLPMAAWFRELDERYPDSKFVLTVRDPESWLVSIGKQWANNGREDRVGADFSNAVRLATYGITGFHEQRFRRIHSEHRATVEKHFRDRPEALLVLDVFSGEGWDQLCAFLGNEVPDLPFPNVKPGFEASTVALKRPPGAAQSVAAPLGNRDIGLRERLAIAAGIPGAAVRTLRRRPG